MARRKGRKRGGARRTPSRGLMPTVGHLYYAGSGLVTPSATQTIVDSPTYSELSLPLDRPIKVLKLKVTLSTSYKASPRRVRFQIGNTSTWNGVASTAERIMVPMRATVLVVRAPSGSDYVLNKTANIGVGLLTLFANTEVEPVTVLYEAWVAVGPPATD